MTVSKNTRPDDEVLKNINQSLADLLDSIKALSENPIGEAPEEIKKSVISYCDLLRREFLIGDDDIKDIKKDISKIFRSAAPKAVIFGAGISMGDPFGLPNWSGLLKNAVTEEFIYSNELFETKNEIVEDKDTFLSLFDLYELAQFLENNRRDSARNEGYSDDEIEERVAKEMAIFVEKSLKPNKKYFEKCSDVNDTANQFGKWKQRDPSSNATLDNSYIYRLVDFVIKKNIKRVITYNYDNAFEYAYSLISGFKKSNKQIKPIFIDDDLPTAETRNKLPIYHVHGYIPIFDDSLYNDKNIEKSLKDAKAKHLILSEQSYDDIAHSGYKWRNTVQIDTFLRYNCFFFGFSASDVNFKRIVKLMDWHNEYSAGNKDDVSPVKHYIIMNVDDFIKGIFGKSCIDIDDKNNKKLCLKSKVTIKDLDTKLKFLYHSLRMKRKYLRGLHIYPIWTTIYDCVKLANNFANA